MTLNRSVAAERSLNVPTRHSLVVHHLERLVPDSRAFARRCTEALGSFAAADLTVALTAIDPKDIVYTEPLARAFFTHADGTEV
ncbi:MAG: hypothetical protein AAFY29_11475 [Pseudomonadota bacterium]